MLSTEYRAALDEIWDRLSFAREANRFEALDLINSLVFIKQLDQTEAEKGKLSILSGEALKNAVYTPDQEHLRWRSFHYLDQQSLSELIYQKNGVLDFARSQPEYRRIQKFSRGGEVLQLPPYVLSEIISLINRFDVPNDAVRSDLISYLFHKLETGGKAIGHEGPPSEENLAPLVNERTPVVASRTKKLGSSMKQFALVIFLGAFVIAIFFFSVKKPAGSSTISNSANPKSSKQKDSSSMHTGLGNAEKDTTITKKPVDTDRKMSRTAPNTKSNPVEPKSGKQASEIDSNRNQPGAKNKTRYKILDKAYFHDAPDERTRRAAFLIHWNNSYATLEALDEKNGFIYVVFRNHLNQTSKGWLRKKDLKPIE